MREIANELTVGVKLHAVSALSAPEFEKRVGVWIAGILQQTENLPGRLKGRVGTIGDLRLPTSPHYKPELGWRGVEEAAVAPGVGAIVAYAQGE